MFGLFGILKMLPLILGVAGISYLGHWFVVKNLKNQISQQEERIIILTQENIALKISTQEQQETIIKLRHDIQQQINAISGLTVKASKWEELAKRYNEIFADHDLTALSQARPGLIEIRINKETKKVLNEIEESAKDIE